MKEFKSQYRCVKCDYIFTGAFVSEDLICDGVCPACGHDSGRTQCDVKKVVVDNEGNVKK